MKPILLAIPRDKYEGKYLEIYSKKFGISLDSLKILKKYFKEDIYFILSVLEKQKTIFASIDEGNDIKMMIEIHEYIKNNNNTFDDKITHLSKDLKISTNKVFQLYNEYINLMGK